MMLKVSPTHTRSLFCARMPHLFMTFMLMTLLLCTPKAALAASWQWQKSGLGERLLVRLDAQQSLGDKKTGVIKAKRIGQHSVLIPIKTGTLVLQGAAPVAGTLVLGLQNSEDGVFLQVQNSAFGFMVRQTSPTEVIVDVFPDPLGARWRPDGSLAPEGTQGVAPGQTAPPIEQSQVLPPNTPHSIAPQGAPTHAPANTAPPMQMPPVQKTPQAPALPPEAKKKAPYLVAEATLPDTLDFVTPPLAAAATPADINDMLGDAETLMAALERGRSVTPQELTGRVNKEGPEAWPKEESLGTYLPNQGDDANAIEQNAAPAGIDPSIMPTIAPSATTPDPSIMPTIAPSATTPDPSIMPEIAPTTSPTAAPDPSIMPTIVPSATTQDPVTPAAPTTPPSLGQPSVTPAQALQEDIGTEGNSDGVRQAVAPVPGQEGEEANERPVVYHDEEGNLIPKPADPDQLFAEAEKLMDTQKYREALPILEELKAIPTIAQSMREQVLYYISDATAMVYKDKPLEGFDPIVTTTTEAMNANLRSARVPDALYRLGLANLGVKNFPEADAYFKALKRRFPYDMNVPTAFYLLGESQFESGLYADAAENFKSIVQEYPDASSLEKATVGYVKALAKNKEYKEASVFADFASKRWARHYIEDPEYLLYLAEIDYKLGNKKGALDQYWLLYNLDPDHKRNDLVLATIGDIYLELDMMREALEVFKTIQEAFPDTRGAAIALLRQSELGIHDSPLTLEEMFTVFANPGTPLPQVVYKDLQKNWPEDERSVTSELKYTLWQLWDKQYTDAMGSAADFIDLHPENDDVELARDVIMRGFMADMKNALAEENYGRILILWDGFPIIRERYGTIDPDLRNALGRGYLERGEDEKAMEMLADFLQTPKHPRYSDPTFALYFNKYLESGNWNGMLDLGEMVKNWEMTEAMRGQLDYALALSSQNLGLKDKALKLWKPLVDNAHIPLYQKAYANYFLAKNAEERKDITEAYTYNVKTLELFEQLHEERSDRADNERIKEAMGSLMDITEVANRIPEALEWVERYNQYVPEGSPEYPGLRFREARLYRKLGNDDRAKMLLELITTGYPDSPFAAAAATELSTFEVSRDLQNFMQGANARQ